ncbi:Asparagine synthetase domain-containing protein 1 [Mytilus coruscus]|uniref:Asparagine synthetase domain-containing protein 1 n=1 Tax=Mytilus coruscus TaxID=42192 RepID=A0A6J8DHL6_MYTCO|nr:Asparagine synthetase domain-containing protein 1 [Mytilus coruscus]
MCTIPCALSFIDTGYKPVISSPSSGAFSNELYLSEHVLNKTTEMCGICCLLIERNEKDYNDPKHCMEYGQIRHRGPDSSNTKEVTISDKHVLTLTGHVLHLRGQLTSQPLQHQNGDLLLWNGEIFGGIQIREEENDTEILLQLLTKDTSPKHILKTMATVEGPWSFIYWQNATQTLYFGRDMFGRRSLLWHLPQTVDDVFMLSSVRISDYEFQEVPSVGLFSMHVSSDVVTMTMYPRDEAVWPGTSFQVRSSDPRHFCIPFTLAPNFDFQFKEAQVVPMSIPKLNKQLQCIIRLPLKNFSTDANELMTKSVLDEDSISSFVSKKDNISESSDCVHEMTTMPESSSVPERANIPSSSHVSTGNKKNVNVEILEEIIDPKSYLENVLQTDALMNKLSDQLMDVLLKAVTLRVYNQVDLPRTRNSGVHCQRMETLQYADGSSEMCQKTSVTQNHSSNNECECCVKKEGDCDRVTCLIGNVHLENPCKSESNRNETLPCKTAEDNLLPVNAKNKEPDITDNTEDSLPHVPSSCSESEIVGNARVAVLFSGGIDSAVITALVDRCLPEDEPVDLMNVAFEQKAKSPQKKKGESINWKELCYGESIALRKESIAQKREVLPEEYHIKRLIARKFENHEFLYLVKWRGFPESDSTWEPTGHIDMESLQNYEYPIISSDHLSYAATQFEDTVQ